MVLAAGDVPMDAGEEERGQGTLHGTAATEEPIPLKVRAIALVELLALLEKTGGRVSRIHGAVNPTEWQAASLKTCGDFVVFLLEVDGTHFDTALFVSCADAFALRIPRMTARMRFASLSVLKRAPL